ncbi:MAG TPA: aminotransferase class IV [Planctomycetaceae bacterium]|nr:aminotransferase class IV [Planctomycetaceae bacterium]
MSEPIAYLHGRFVPVSQASLHVFDLGIVGGVAVSEMLRTFQHAPFRVDEHLQRLQQSHELTGLRPQLPMAELRDVLMQVVRHNTGLMSFDDDLGVIVFVTAGLNPTYVGREAATHAGCSVGVHTFPLPYATWAAKYDAGVELAVSQVPALPNEIVDRRIKSRSRLHWTLADRDVRARFPNATALLLDADGSVTETAACNVCIVKNRVVSSPPPGTVLEGVSLSMLLELATKLGLNCERRRLTVDDVAYADEVWLTSTPPCVLPVTRFEGRPVGNGQPGPLYRELLAAWSDAVGVDIRGQMQRTAGASR